MKVQVGAGFFTNPNLKNMFPVKLGIHFLQKIGEIGENLNIWSFTVSPFRHNARGFGQGIDVQKYDSGGIFYGRW